MRRPRLALLSLLGCLSSPSILHAEEPVDRHGVVLDLPLVDLPFNARHGFSWPGMPQSLALSASAYQLLHGGLGHAFDPYEGEWWQRLLGKG
nr:hypothetical protein [Polyangiaceae bacterium]